MTPHGSDQFPTEPVLACSLTGRDRTERARWLQQLRTWAVGVRSRPTGVVLAFAAADGLEADIRALARAEAECCPFLRLEVHAGGGTIELAVSGPPEAQPIIEEMFASR
jgi:MerR family copper efflux transcriptional regulator